MKSYTDIEQSKKLAEFLPLESADMHWQYIEEDNGQLQWFCFPKDFSINQYNTVSAWSLVALLDLIPFNVTFNKAVYRFKMVKYFNHWECYHENFGSVSTGIFEADNPVDVCYEMIIKLHEQKIL